MLGNGGKLTILASKSDQLVTLAAGSLANKSDQLVPLASKSDQLVTLAW